MPAWSAAGQTSLSAGESLQVLATTEAIAANVGLQGFSFTPEPMQVVISVLNNSGVSLTLQKSVDGVTWLAVNYGGGGAISFLTATATDYVAATGVYYRLMNANQIPAGGAVWVAR
jgi:hypothetical protein